MPNPNDPRTGQQQGDRSKDQQHHGDNPSRGDPQKPGQGGDKMPGREQSDPSRQQGGRDDESKRK